MGRVGNRDAMSVTSAAARHPCMIVASGRIRRGGMIVRPGAGGGSRVGVARNRSGHVSMGVICDRIGTRDGTVESGRVIMRGELVGLIGADRDCGAARTAEAAGVEEIRNVEGSRAVAGPPD